MNNTVRGLGFRARIVTFSFRSLGRVIYYLRLISLTVLNRKAIPRKGPIIIACNHISVLDPVFLWCALRRPAIALAMAELWARKTTRWLMNLLAHIPVVRGSRESGIKAIKDAVIVLQHGGVIIIYPQGRCIGKNEDDAHVHYESGVYWIAKRSGAPVLATHISGTNDMLPLKKDRIKGKKIFDHKASVRLAFAVTMLNAGDYATKAEFLAALRKSIDSLAPTGS
jgi:1-acyl-sn-glycerol-3-phosphate acyltransferase